MCKLVVHPQKCTGCKACMIACSYHHTSSFSKSNASIKIFRNEREGAMGIKILKKEDGCDYPCDCCSTEKTPLCVKFCVVGAIESLKS